MLWCIQPTRCRQQKIVVLRVTKKHSKIHAYVHTSFTYYFETISQTAILWSKYNDRRAGTVCWQSWPPQSRWSAEMTSVWTVSSLTATPSLFFPLTWRGKIVPTDGSFYLQRPGRAAPLPVTRQWHFVKQDKVVRALAPDNHALFLIIFLSMWFAWWKLFTDHTYVWSIHTSINPPQNGRNVLEYQTLKKNN